MRISLGLLLFVTLLSTSGCGKLLGSLRRDLDDDPYWNAPPTTGGRWSEKGLLADPADDPRGRYSSVGHNERGPASARYQDDRQDGWISQERAEQNARDRMRYEDDGSDGPATANLTNTPNLEPPVKRQYRNGGRATRADFVDESPNEGSLWASDGQTNYYFTKNKVRGVGDIVNITVEADMVKDVTQEVRRTLTPRERDYELGAAQERIRARVLGLPDPDAKKPDGKQDAVATSAAAPARGITSEQVTGGQAGSALDEKKDKKEIPEATSADIDVLRSLDIKPGEVVMAEIVERYPNGNYKVRGTKRIPYKGGAPRFMTLTAVAKSQDISEEDVITSGKLYEYRLESAR